MNTRPGFGLLTTLLVLLFVGSAGAVPTNVTKTNSMPVYMHYMPWFNTPSTLGANNWGWHWTLNNQNPNVIDAQDKRQIASHYYPIIGPYDSSDPDVIEYHLLLMKYSGVDGVLIDWYGVQGTNGDVAQLLSNSNAIVDQVDDVGLEFGVVLEDRFSANVSQAQANVAYLRDNYFNKPEYIRLGADQDPLLPVYGPITFETQNEWTQILSQAGEPVDLLTLWYESNEPGTNADGEFAWITQTPGTNDHFTRLNSFYNNQAPLVDVVGGSIYPGFDDFYTEGGVGGIYPEIPHNNGQTLDNTILLANAQANQVDFIQLNTFNDFGEGTIFEPTLETGYEYLKKIQQYTGVPYGEDELKLIYRLYMARKRYAGNAAVQSSLDTAADMLSMLQVESATSILDSSAPLGDYNGNGVVELLDYVLWNSEYGTQTVLVGSGADGNFDGYINSIDYTLWRNEFEAAGGFPANATPEPDSATLAGVTAIILWVCQTMRSQVNTFTP